MALKNIYKSTKTTENSIVIPEINKHLIKISQESNDRAIDVNAPSQIFGCMRANYYARIGVESKENVDPRLMRIFGNGDHVHLRLQEYLLDSGMLLLDEVPVLNKTYNIQGHTDGVLDINGEKIVLELKSINSHGFANLKTAREDHVHQAMTYLFCLETRRIHLRNEYHTPKEFNAKRSIVERREFFKSRYQHMQDGDKYTRNQKINRQVSLNFEIDAILYDTPKPITKVCIVYENKDNQELKEFIVEKDDNIIEDIKQYCLNMNHAVKYKKIPERGGESKSSSYCRWCNYRQNVCWDK